MFDNVRNRDVSSLVGELPDDEISKEDLQKIKYANYVEIMENKNLRSQMEFLLEMGYLDFVKNEQLLIKHSGNLTNTVNELAMC